MTMTRSQLEAAINTLRRNSLRDGERHKKAWARFTDISKEIVEEESTLKALERDLQLSEASCDTFRWSARDDNPADRSAAQVSLRREEEQLKAIERRIRNSKSRRDALIQKWLGCETQLAKTVTAMEARFEEIRRWQAAIEDGPNPSSPPHFIEHAGTSNARLLRHADLAREVGRDHARFFEAIRRHLHGVRDAANQVLVTQGPQVCSDASRIAGLTRSYPYVIPKWKVPQERYGLREAIDISLNTNRRKDANVPPISLAQRNSTPVIAKQNRPTAIEEVKSQ